MQEAQPATTTKATTVLTWGTSCYEVSTSFLQPLTIVLLGTGVVWKNILMGGESNDTLVLVLLTFHFDEPKAL